MTDTLTKHEKNLSTLIHAGTFTKFFFPLGNFIVPLVLWTANRKQYSFVDYNGKQALNFQISLLLYAFILGAFSIPFFIGFLPNPFDFGSFSMNDVNHFKHFNLNFNSSNFSFNNWLIPIAMGGLIHTSLFIVNIVYTILAVIKTNEGQKFAYPLSIKFIK